MSLVYSFETERTLLRAHALRFGGLMGLLPRAELLKAEAESLLAREPPPEMEHLLVSKMLPVF
jgi:hypothetical protein